MSSNNKSKSKSLQHHLASAQFFTQFSDTNKGDACIKLVKVIGRLSGLISKYGASPYSINKLGLIKTLDVINQGMSLTFEEYKGMFFNTKSTIITLAEQKKLLGFFKGGLTLMKGIKLFEKATLPIQVLSIFKDVYNNGRNTLNNSKKIVSRVLSGLSFVNSLMLVILFFASYLANIQHINTKAELKGMYILMIYAKSLFEVFKERILKPTTKHLKKSQKISLEKGIICSNEVEPAYARVIMSRSKTLTFT